MSQKRKKSPVSGKAIIALAALLFVLTITTLLYQREKPFLPNQLKTSLFSDVSQEDLKDNLVKSSIAYLESKGIMKGYPDGSFKPEKAVNRAEFLKILVAALVPGELQDKKVICFSDVQIEDWFSKYVCYAKEKEWVTGYEDKTFKPANTINQAEMMKMLVTAFGWDTDTFTDQKLPMSMDGEGWFVKYAKVILAKNIMTGAEMDSAKLVTRKEVAIIIFKSLLVDTLKIDAYSEGKISDFFKLQNVVISGEPKPITVEPKPKSKK